ncbi:adenylyltransferase/cytidyltransferase family protein (plasmid) [Halorussus salilacus]|uniref:adenylyltransferase/cytidyltransferase family protein n=1 Tax=Halorussus salilacus TaxID=2953750 RepID=UPI00209C7769|nr:adenylyltransferase/cytidyltransferase family protein [Halorussus salilacus]USZ70015.1 adenylyltransferase/cytidyltransferase family protein [Halorussus salilacus]
MIGHIHGRFQPFHDGHLEYVKWAADTADRLIVGITNSDSSHTEKERADSERHRPEANPFRYFERFRMVRDAINDSSVDVPVEIHPFPINRPELWKYYAPESCVHFVYVLEEWHEVKVRRLRERDRQVYTKRKQRDISASQIREAMIDDEDWRTHVPSAVVNRIEAIDGQDRVTELAAGERPD